MKMENSLSEPAWQPMVCLEATFYPSPGFEYLDKVPLGETEPCPMEPMIAAKSENGLLSADHPLDIVHSAFLRPGMYDIHSVHELVTFLIGVAVGARPPHGAGSFGDFFDYLNRCLHQPVNAAWMTTLQGRFQDRPFTETCETLSRIFLEWRKSKQ